MATTAKIRLYKDTKKTNVEKTTGGLIRLYDSDAPEAKPATNKFGMDVSTHVMNPLNPNNQLGQPVPKVDSAFKPSSLWNATKKIGNYLYDTASQIVAPGITPEEARNPQILKDTLNPLNLVKAGGNILDTVVRHPVDTALTVVSSAARGISDVITNGIINVTVPKEDREATKQEVDRILTKYLDVSRSVRQTPEMQALGQGFHAGGSAAPFIAAGGIAGEAGVALGRATTPLAETISRTAGMTAGFVGAGQTQVPLEATVKERANQLMNDLVGLGLFTLGSSIYGKVKTKATTAIRESLLTNDKGFPKSDVTGMQTPIEPKVELKVEFPKAQMKAPITPKTAPGEAIAPQFERSTKPGIEGKWKIKPQESTTEIPLKQADTIPIVETQSKEYKVKTEFQSRVFERLKSENPALEGDLNYDPIKLKEDAGKAVDLIAKDKQKAYDIAMGKEKSGEITSTALNIALAEKALAEGDNALYAKLVTNRSLAQTRRGQELVAEKGSVTDNSTSRYVKELVAGKLDKLGKDYLSDLKDVFKKKSTKERAMNKIDNEVAKLEKNIKNKKVDVKTALSLLEKLTCV